MARVQAHHGKQYSDPLVGRRVGKLVVIRRLQDRKSGAKNVRAIVLVQCDCGSRTEVPRYYLLRDNPKTHCGCEAVQSIQRRFPGEYGSWTMMKARCYDEKHVSYDQYGGRGIRVQASWLVDFEQFLMDLGIRPTPHHTLDRIDVNGNYTKDNCRWATATEQRANQRPRGEPEAVAQAEEPAPEQPRQDSPTGE